MLYIFVEIDTWSSPAVQLTGETNTIQMVKKDGSYRSRIKDFWDVEREQIQSTLEE